MNHTDVLVIANALHAHNVSNWAKPIYQAFSSQEIKDIKSWVNNGGSLLLISDHMPFPGAIDSLAFSFGVLDGFARDSIKVAKGIGGPDVLRGAILLGQPKIVLICGSSFA